MKSPVFSRARKEIVAAVLVAAGSSSFVACKSKDANYRPAPNYTQPVARPTAPAQRSCGAAQPSQPTYVPPTTYTPPAYVPPAQPAAPQHACGKGKCG